MAISAIINVGEDKSWMLKGRIYDAMVAVFNDCPHKYHDNPQTKPYASHNEITERIKALCVIEDILGANLNVIGTCTTDPEGIVDFLIGMWVANASHIGCFPKDPWILDRLEEAMNEHFFMQNNAFQIPNFSVEEQAPSTESKAKNLALQVAVEIHYQNKLVSHAMMIVAEENNASYEKVRAAYYKYKSSMVIDDESIEILED